MKKKLSPVSSRVRGAGMKDGIGFSPALLVSLTVFSLV
jgi:hypothetical protein